MIVIEKATISNKLSTKTQAKINSRPRLKGNDAESRSNPNESKTW